MKPELKFLISEALREDCLGLAGIESEIILTAILICGNNKTQAAQMLGISSRTLRRKIDEYGWEWLKGEWPADAVAVESEERDHV